MRAFWLPGCPPRLRRSGELGLSGVEIPEAYGGAGLTRVLLAHLVADAPQEHGGVVPIPAHQGTQILLVPVGEDEVHVQGGLLAHPGVEAHIADVPLRHAVAALVVANGGDAHARFGDAAQRSSDPAIASSGKQIANSATYLRLRALEASANLMVAAAFPGFGPRPLRSLLEQYDHAIHLLQSHSGLQRARSRAS